jgi:hypothetical protein
MVVRDQTSGVMGSVSQRVEVPLPGSLRLATPILTDAVERPAVGGGRPRPALAAHRTFRPAGQLFCEFEVLGAARSPGDLPRVAAGLELRRADGRLVRQAPLTPVAADPDGRVVRLVGIGLDGMSEGPYDLMLVVRDEASGARIERHEAFSLAGDAGSR